MQSAHKVPKGWGAVSPQDWTRETASEFTLDKAVPAKHTFAAMQHSPGFLKVVNEVRPRIREVTLEDARRRLEANAKAVLIDVREDNEWAAGHARQAIHLGRGILERDIEGIIPDHDAECILYCGGGYRSALAADMVQRMGYKNVASLIGGYKALVAAGWPTTT
jgi:rhodanese-related sulfurtransferase